MVTLQTGAWVRCVSTVSVYVSVYVACLLAPFFVELGDDEKFKFGHAVVFCFCWGRALLIADDVSGTYDTCFGARGQQCLARLSWHGARQIRQVRLCTLRARLLRPISCLACCERCHSASSMHTRCTQKLRKIMPRLHPNQCTHNTAHTTQHAPHTP